MHHHELECHAKRLVYYLRGQGHRFQNCLVIISNGTSVHLVWLPRDKWYRRYQIHTDLMDITLTLTLKTIHFLQTTHQLMMMCQQIKFGCQKISSLVDMVETVIFSYMNPWRQQTHLLAWYWPMMMYHHTKFGYKRFSTWEDIIQVNTHWNFEPFLWPWP